MNMDLPPPIKALVTALARCFEKCLELFVSLSSKAL